MSRILLDNFMEKLCLGDKLQIQCYKHNGKIHRCWSEAVLLEMNKDYMVFGNDRTLVIESDGRTRKTSEPAIMYFFKNKWFNIIAQLKKDGISYYCNIASPFIIEDQTIKYIDYDLDLRIYNNGEYKILDKMEYKYHKKIMNYSDDLDTAIHNGLEELINCYNKKNRIFSTEFNMKYYKEYLKIRNENNIENNE